MKKFVLCSVFMLLAIVANAQSYTTISGTVKDLKTGKTISNVTVAFKNVRKGTHTDANGHFQLQVPTKTKTVQFSKIGYETVVKNIASLSSSEPFIIFLQKEVIALDEVQIDARKQGMKPAVLAVGKLPIKDIDAPVTTNSVDQRLLLQRGVDDLGTAVKSATGVRPINRYGGFQTFRIRGFNNFVLLLDGVRDERHNISTSAPSTNLANVARIEVLKGPASVLYGHSALGGIINIVRKKPTLHDTGNFTISYGSYKSYTMSAGFGGSISPELRYRTDFGLTRSQGWRDYGVATNNGSFALTYTPSSKDRLDFYLQVNDDQYDTDTGIPMDDDGSLVPGLDPKTRYNDPQDYLKHKRYDAQLKYTHEFSETSKLTNLLSYASDDIDYLSTEFLVLNATKDAIKRDFPFYFNHQTKTLQNQLDYSFQATTGSIKHQLLLGNSLSFLDRKTFRGKVIGPGTFTTISVQNPVLNQGHIEAVDDKVDVKEEFVSGFYLQDAISFSEHFKAMIGLRYDIFDGTYYRDELNKDRVVLTSGTRTTIPSTAFTYRAGVVYQPIPDALSFFASYSNYFKPSRRVAPNGVVFDPEKGYQIEGGVKYQKNQRFSATLSTYYLLKNNIVERTSVNDYQQIGEADSKGVELDIETQPVPGFYLKAGYAFVDAKVRSYNPQLQRVAPGNSLRFAPKHSANFWANYEFQSRALHGIGLGFGGNYVSSNFTNSSNTFTLPAYTTLDGTIYYQAKRVRIGVNINNLANTLYYTDAIYDRQFFVGQGRNFRISLAYKL